MSNLDICLSSYSCDTEISLIKQIVKSYNLNPYFKLLLEKLRITDFDKFIEDNTDLNKNHTALNIFKRTLCIYEGCIHNHLGIDLVKVGILYGFFNGLFKRNEFIEQVHSRVSKNPLADENLSMLLDIIDRSTFKNNTNDLICIIKDSSRMVIYWDNFLNPEINKLFSNYFKTMPAANKETAVRYVYTNIKKTKWVTRWATMKAFNRNFNKIVDLREIEAIKFVKEN